MNFEASTFRNGEFASFGQTARNFSFAHASGPNHDDVLGNDFFGQSREKLLAAHAVAQRNGHGALGVLLADDMLVELGDDFARSELVERELFFFSVAW